MTYVVAAALMALMAWLVKYKKVTWLITGYNTASNEERKKYDLDKLCRLFGNYLFILAGIMLIMGILSIAFPALMTPITWIGLAILLIVLIGGMVYMNTNNRIKKE